MKYGKRRGAPESFIAGSVGFVQKRSIPEIILGMLCRFAVAFVGAAGVCIMFDNAFRFSGAYEPGKDALICLAFCAAWFLLCTAANVNGVFLGVVSGAYLTALICGVIRLGVKASFVYVPAALWDHVLGHLDSLGFTALSGLRTSLPECDPLTEQGALYVKIGFYAFCAIASLIFVSCLYKKVRAVPVIITAGIVMTLTFTYNLLSDNLGFTLTVASGFGVLVLLYYASFTKDRLQLDDKAERFEGYFSKKRRAVTRASAPGLSAAVAVLLVLAISAYPAIKISKSAPKLTVLDSFIEQARDVFSRYLTGNSSDEIEYDAYQKTTEPTARNFSNRQLLTVTADYPSPVYLRAWVSETFSNNKWTSASASESDINILPEQITELFYTVVDVDANVYSGSGGADTEYGDRGFIKERVTVKSEALAGDVGFLASRFSTIYGVTEADSDKSYGKGYRLKDGVGTAELSMKGAKYGTVAYTPNYKKILLSNLDSDLFIYETVLPFIEEYAERRLGKTVSDAELEDWLDGVKNRITSTLATRNLKIPAGSLINRVSDMSDKDISAFMEKLAEARKYESYVYENCVSVPWSDEKTFTKAAYDAFGGKTTDAPSDVYSCANRTARYLERMCEYSLAPEGYSDYGSYISQFLTTARSGYCVQYATAGAMILRAAGIPTRYVDGYLASEFRNIGGKYVSPVLDSHAHAWIEVYIRGYGWMTFEMTEPMLNGLYRVPGEITFIPEEETTEPVTKEKDEESSDAETDPPVTRPRESMTLPEDDTGTDRTNEPLSPEKLIKAGVVFLAVLVVLTLIFIYIKKTSNAAKKRQEMLQKASKGESADPTGDLNEITRYIFFMFERLGLKRDKTELMTDFVKRADRKTYDNKSFAAAAHAIQKNSFGRCADEKDCKDAADYAIYLRKITERRLSLPEKIWYFKVLKKI